MNARARRALLGIRLERPYDFEGWRTAARGAAAAGIPPEDILWTEGDDPQDMFAAAPLSSPPPARPVRVSQAYLHLARHLVLHRSPERLPLLYRLLWRLQGEARLMENVADADVHRADIMAGQVRRDRHKMRAFVRFRQFADADGGERYVAWFEPAHHVVRANAEFFRNRFASQRWSILTPDLCLHWDGEMLAEAPGASRADAPAEDAAEELWQLYYASIFNPARLKVGMMVKEMPRRYWRNLPEAQLIPALVAGAQAREAGMIDKGQDRFESLPPETLDEIASGIVVCRRCPIGCNGTRAVAGEGPADAELMIVGEQPGDREEVEGRPFVGPAGQLLDRHLQRAGLDRAAIRITNAVRHFKFEQRGKRRLHQNPTAGEIDHCRWWLDAERRIIRPRLILAMGASAGRALLGRTPSIGRERGQAQPLPDGSLLWLTAHPSYLLRLDGEAREREDQRLQQDLAGVAAARRG